MTTSWRYAARECGPFSNDMVIVPKHCDFDPTSLECWVWLLVTSREKKFRLKRDKIINDAKIEILAQVLANTNGMSTFYWTMLARDAVTEECRLRELSYTASSPQ